jgi:hypothetical protein
MPPLDLLLHIDSYPEPSPPDAIKQAVRFAAMADGVLSALAVQVEFHVRGNWLAEHLIGLSGLARDEEHKSARACQAGLALFSSEAAAAGMLGDTLCTKADAYGLGEHVAAHARTRDVCLVPVTDPFDGQRSVVEAVLFESGRPALLF